MIDLNELRSIAEEHGAELEILPHQEQPMVVISVKKGNMAVSSEFGINLFREKADDGRPWAIVLFLKMLDRLEEAVSGRTDESGIRSGG
jgi:hypothetical protein